MTAVITLKVKLVADVDGSAIKKDAAATEKKAADNFRDFQERIEREQKEEKPEETGKKEEKGEGEFPPTPAEKAKDVIGQVDSKGRANLQRAASNPSGFVGDSLIRALGSAGPYGALTAAIVGTVLASPALLEAVVKAMGVKGGPLNQDYAFSAEEQENLLFGRLVQFQKLTGDDYVITSEDRGFAVGDPDFVLNSLVDVETARVGRIGLRQNSLGYVHGI